MADDLKLSRILWIAGAYTLVVTGLYLFGYWGRLGLNVLEYIGIGDIVSHALMPFLATIVSLAFGFALSTVIHGARFQSGEGADTIIGRFGRTHWRQLAILDLVAILSVVLFGTEPLKWFLVAMLMIPLTVLPTHLDYFIELMPNPSVRASLLQFPLIIAALSFAQGRLQADNLLKGAGPLLVDVVGSGLQLKSDAAHPVSYVGHVADFFVLYDSAQSQVVLLNAQKVNSLALIKNPKAAF